MNVKTGNAQNKQILSALPPLATGERTFRIGSFVPCPELMHRSKIQAYSIPSFAIVSTLRKVPQFGT